MLDQAATRPRVEGPIQHNHDRRQDPHRQASTLPALASGRQAPEFAVQV